MTSELYRAAPRNAAPAAIEVARLAYGGQGDAYRRDLVDGAVEVLVMEDGHLQRYVVAADGTSSLVQTAPRSRRYATGLWMTRIGFGLWLGVIVGAGAAGPVVGDLGGAGFLLAAVVAIGALVLLIRGNGKSASETVLQWLGANAETDAGWRAVAELRLSGSGDLTAEQIASAERLAVEHGGSLARQLPDRNAEVVGTSGGRLYRYRVTEKGDAMQVEQSALSLVYAFSIVLCAGGWLVAGALWILPVELDGRLLFFGALGTSVLGVILAGLSQTAYRRLRRQGTWVEFKTPPPEE
jgi:hypothetical protein